MTGQETHKYPPIFAPPPRWYMVVSRSRIHVELRDHLTGTTLSAL